MMLYRIVGRVEAFPNTGLLQIEPTSYSTRDTAIKRLKALARGFDKGQLVKRYDLRLEKISIPSILTKEQIMGLVTHDLYIEDLIEKCEVIYTLASGNSTHESA